MRSYDLNLEGLGKVLGMCLETMEWEVGTAELHFDSCVCMCVSVHVCMCVVILREGKSQRRHT